jgi:hypothetical protein
MFVLYLAHWRIWLVDYTHGIEQSLAKGQSVYSRDNSFDEAIDLLFPKLTEHLSSPLTDDLMDGRR